MRWIFVFLLGASQLWAGPMKFEDFDSASAGEWRYVSDRVMGGVSDGGATFAREGDITFARLEGRVSTENNGGFIQVRRELAAPFPATSTGLSLRVRGNGERYYVHLRPKSARRPWHFFQASFETTQGWQDVTLAWSDFTAQGGLSAGFDAAEIVSIGLVAYGAEYQALLDVAEISVN